MTFAARTKDAAGDVIRAADQNESVDNDDALMAALLGPYPPAATGGMVRQWVKLTGIADNVATEIFTVTTTNEAGDHDGGVYSVEFHGLGVHVGGEAGDNAVCRIGAWFVRAMKSTGVGQLSALTAQSDVIAESEGGATKGISAVTCTVAETSEYITSFRVAVNLDGTTITDATVCGMVELYYHGFLTEPVITSAG